MSGPYDVSWTLWAGIVGGSITVGLIVFLGLEIRDLVRARARARDREDS